MGKMLLAEGRELGPVEVAETAGSRFRGLLGRTSLDGALLLRPCSSVHTIGMRMTIDVAYCTRDLEVLDVLTMKPWRMGRPRRRAKVVLETEQGVMAEWGLRPGLQLTLG